VVMASEAWLLPELSAVPICVTDENATMLPHCLVAMFVT
jgi:hypothetical protein